ncbi:hypothetical protein PDIG_49850 [Penicillium digitatum PHI26]|uniref:Uncharacterized protein n=1 Tax=Penicillium digitatum (strain PHI26 / CECT 20796) TaxID=1170229 RepID=K9FSM4_PEND2|nr:hypothetical protein PDIG_49850 [Penicillium digitatum PHI26]
MCSIRKSVQIPAKSAQQVEWKEEIQPLVDSLGLDYSLPELLPIHTTTTSLHWAAICSNQLYHVACILLPSLKLEFIKLQSTPVTPALWRARHIGGILLANTHHGCLNKSLQPLWIAGRLFSHVSEYANTIPFVTLKPRLDGALVGTSYETRLRPEAQATICGQRFPIAGWPLVSTLNLNAFLKEIASYT